MNFRGTSSSITQTASTDIGSIGTAAGTSAGSIPAQMGSSIGAASSMTHELSQDEYEAMAAVKKSSSKKSSPPARRRLPVIRVLRTPGGKRVKLVGDELAALGPMLVGWADKLGKDLRVVITNGEAPYQFYGRPMVEQRMRENGLCLFLTGRNGRDDSKMVSPNDTPLKWRVGLDEIAAERAPAKLDSPEFPSYANIHDEKKVFIGRVEGKFIYTMLYIPTRLEQPKDVPLPGDLAMKPVPIKKPDAEKIAPFVNYVLARYEKMVEDYALEIAGGLSPLSFKEFCGDSKRKRQRALQEQIEKHQKEIRETEQRLMKQARDLRDAQKDMALTLSGAFDAELEAEADRLNRLVDNGLYERFKVRHGRLMGMTTPIVIEYNGKPYNLGQFAVGISKDGSYQIAHPTKQHPFHPHINSSGGLCMGSFRNDIPKLIGLERYAMVFQVFYEFLSSYNDKDKYNKIEVCTGEQQAPEMAEAGTPGQANPMPEGIVQAAPADPRDFDMPTDNERMNADMRQIEQENRQWIERSIGIPRESLQVSSRPRTGMEMRMVAGDNAPAEAAPTQPQNQASEPF